MRKCVFTLLALPATLAWVSQAQAVADTWSSDNGGNWNTSGAGGWSGGTFPSSVTADTATLSADLTGNRTVIVNVNNAAMSTLTMNDTGADPDHGWIIASDANNYALQIGSSISASAISPGNGNGAYEVSSDIVLGATAGAFTVHAYPGAQLTLSGDITEQTGARSLVIRRGGTVILTGDNTFSGGVSVSLEGSSLKFDSISDTLASAVGIGTTNFSFGINNDAVLEYTGSANGSSARGITVGTGAGNPTLSVTGAGSLTLSGDLVNTAGSGTKTLRLGGTNSADNTYSGRIVNGASSLSAITKQDGGVWVLSRTGTANTYTGATTISGGVLRGIDGSGVSAGSLVTINGGVWESSADIVRVGGSTTASQQMRVTGGVSGFSARGAAISVAFGSLDTPSSLTWGQTSPFSFVPTTLVLNEATADSALDFKNPLSLGNAQRLIEVRATASSALATLSGAVTHATGGIEKGGVGTLVLSNLANTYGGATNVNAGTFLLNGNHTGAGNYLVAPGATLGGSTGNLTLAANKSITLSNSGAVRSNFAPGSNGVGKFTVNTATSGTGSISLAGANYVWQLGGFTDAPISAGTAYDQLVLNSGGATTSLTLEGVSQITVAFTGLASNPDAGNAFWQTDHVWKLIDTTSATVSGSIVSLANSHFTAGDFTSFVGDGTNGGETGDVYLKFTAVPEPAALSLLALGIAPVLSRKRRDRAPRAIATLN